MEVGVWGLLKDRSGCSYLGLVLGVGEKGEIGGRISWNSTGKLFSSGEFVSKSW